MVWLIDNKWPFIKGRQIMDVVLVTNEYVDSRQGSRKPWIVCKLDIQKAYDHLNWKFLLSLPEKMGFGPRWIKWISQCIHKVRFSILINREPNGFSPSQRGLRQGDPLPFFFFSILAMEGMNNLLNKAKRKGWIKGFQMGEKNSLEVIHLWYTNDTMIFCEAVEE